MNEAGIAGDDAGLTIAALREGGAAGFDPLRFCYIEALARRSLTQVGEARRLLDGRLAKALAAYKKDFEEAAARGPAAGPESGDSSSPLADLVAYIEEHAAADGEGGAFPATNLVSGPYEELKSLRQFRETWSKLSVDQQLTQAIAQGPQNAGPLNSHLLVLRSLECMRDISPAYLSRFMAYVDALLWLEQAEVGNAPLKKEADRGGKMAGSKGRKP